MVVDSNQITEEIIKAVEEECGTPVGAWDVSDPQETIAAAFNVVMRTLGYNMVKAKLSSRGGDDVDFYVAHDNWGCKIGVASPARLATEIVGLAPPEADDAT